MINKFTIIFVAVVLIQFSSSKKCNHHKKNSKSVNTIERIVAFPIPCDLANFNSRISAPVSIGNKKSLHKHKNHNVVIEPGNCKCGCRKKTGCTCSDNHDSSAHQKLGFKNKKHDSSNESGHSVCDGKCDCHSRKTSKGCSCSSRNHSPEPEVIEIKQKTTDISLPKLDCDQKALPCLDCEKFAIPAVEIPKVDLSRACNCLKNFMEKKARIHCEKLNCLQSALPPLKMPQFPKLCGCLGQCGC